MSRLAIQILFVVIGVGWLCFVCFDLFIHTFGDCGDERFCIAYKDVAAGLVFWRGLCVAILIVVAYRFFRKEPDA
ncbi:MAG: hypothetical protein ACRYFW_06010 [Janthinobacterium lividum]